MYFVCTTDIVDTLEMNLLFASQTSGQSECCNQPTTPSPQISDPIMAKATKATKHDKRLHQHHEEQLGLAHAKYCHHAQCKVIQSDSTEADVESSLYMQGK